MARGTDKFTKRVKQAIDNPAYVAGYNMAAWPKTIPAPTETDILAARALDVKSWATKEELALAFYLTADSLQVNVYDVGIALQAVLPMKTDDHKANVANEGERRS